MRGLGSVAAARLEGTCETRPGTDLLRSGCPPAGLHASGSSRGAPGGLRSFSRLLLVFLTAPLGIIGASLALNLSGRPFGFVALLGLIALAGMIMRNTVILVDQIETDVDGGVSRREAIVEATVRRARPVVLTALAAIL